MSVCQSSDEISSASDQVISMSQPVEPMGVAAELGQLWLSVLWLESVPLFILSILSSGHQQEGPHRWASSCSRFLPFKRELSPSSPLLFSIYENNKAQDWEMASLVKLWFRKGSKEDLSY